ncbi:hypothetical protein PUN28_001057 [Cardiocondyla obscurior]|uniref:Uncharacterized protein n=1 Tax=Cardiocondyla obscurior TaxID=286306 RepID=A0AAW2H2Q6_9HYME
MRETERARTRQSSSAVRKCERGPRTLMRGDADTSSPGVLDPRNTDNTIRIRHTVRREDVTKKISRRVSAMAWAAYTAKVREKKGGTNESRITLNCRLMNGGPRKGECGAVKRRDTLPFLEETLKFSTPGRNNNLLKICNSTFNWLDRLNEKLIKINASAISSNDMSKPRDRTKSSLRRKTRGRAHDSFSSHFPLRSPPSFVRGFVVTYPKQTTRKKEKRSGAATGTAGGGGGGEHGEDSGRKKE